MPAATKSRTAKKPAASQPAEITGGVKFFSHDLRSPIQGGDPVWNGGVPYVLPKVRVNTGRDECAAGWNFVRQIEDGFTIVGLWPDGYPSRVFAISTESPVVVREKKCRVATLAIERECSEDEIADAIRRFSAVFGVHSEEMIAEQMAWRRALGRPDRNEDIVRTGLEAALKARGGLSWTLKRFDNARAAWAAWDAWAAWAARAALVMLFAARNGWIKEPADLLTVGIRDAYASGLAIAVPVGKDTLGYALVDSKEKP